MRYISLSSFLLFFTLSAQAQKPPIQIKADLSDAPRKFLHAEIDIPVTEGPLTLTTPKWIPGAHSPVGPVSDITGVVFTADGKTLSWRRDDVDLYEFHLIIPAGVTSLHAHLDCIANRATNYQVVLEWEALLLYPAGIPVRDIPVQASVIVPAGWGIGTSLTPLTTTAGTVRYAPTTVEMLEDSPIMTGLYFHEYTLAPNHFIDVFGEAAEDVEIRPTVLEHWKKLVGEELAMYGAPHYRSYHFLLALRGSMGGGGLEHHESSDNALPESALTTDDGEMGSSDLLAHEFTHSWNGKYRRPTGLATPDYATPMKGELLWVYEGLTDYLGKVLAARSGAISREQFREAIALDAATMEGNSGRDWRSIGDTAIAVSEPRGGSAWANWRRSGQDYYTEGDLLWLDVDTTIRKMTKDGKNIKDFLAVYLNKGGGTTPSVVPYDFKELVADLNQVVDYDWASFLDSRVNGLHPHVNVEGIEQGGYTLVYGDKSNGFEKASSAAFGFPDGADVWSSIGLALDDSGTISDVRVGGPADMAKFFPGEKVLAVNETVFSKKVLHAAIAQSKTVNTPMHFILQSGTKVSLVDLVYHDGERHPMLVRNESVPDYLDEIVAPLTKRPD